MKRRYRPFHLFLALLLIFGVISSGILFFAHTHRSTASFCKTEGEYFQENLEESFKEFADFDSDFFDHASRILFEYALFELPKQSDRFYTLPLAPCSFGWVLPLRI
jgi:hypothetical protein